MDSLFDQSALIALAERLVKAARAAGADAADAVAMRSVSQSVEVRDGAVEESQRSEGDDMGLRVLVGRKQAVVSTNDIERRRRRRAGRARGGDGARRARGQVCRPRRSGAAGARTSPISIWSTANCPTSPRSKPLARRAEEAGRAVKGVSKSGGASASAGIGGMVLLTSHGFSGAYLGSRHSISMQAIAGEGTGDGDRLRLLLGAARRRSRCAGEDRHAAPARRRWRGSTRARFRPGRCRWCSTATIAGSIVGHLVERDQRRRDRAQDELPQGQARRADVSRRASTSSTIRCAAAACARGRSTPRASPASAWR